MGYQEACVAAATRQGLDPIVEAVSAAGFSVAVEQTGGFCMVATVEVSDGIVAMTNDGGDDDYMVGFYPANTWYEGTEEDNTTFNLTLDGLVARVKELAK